MGILLVVFILGFGAISYILSRAIELSLIEYVMKPGSGRSIETPEENIKYIESLAERFAEKIRLSSPVEQTNSLYFVKLCETLKATENQYNRLIESYKYDLQNRKQITEDWFNYTRALNQTQFRNELSPTTEDDQDDDGLMREFLTKERIEKKFNALLEHKYSKES